MPNEVGLGGGDVQAHVLDAALLELDVGVADRISDLAPGALGEGEHLVVDVDADDPAGGPDDLRGDEGDLAAAAAEVQHRLALAEVLGGVAAAVVAVEHLLRDDGQEAGGVVDGAAHAASTAWAPAL